MTSDITILDLPRSVWFDTSACAVQLIDQRVLPQSFLTVSCTSIDQVNDAIKNMVFSVFCDSFSNRC